MKRDPANLPPVQALGPHRAARSPFLLALVLAALAVVGCARFEGEWRRAVAGAPSGSTPTPRRSVAEGAWVGTWTSQGTGHEGNLRCVVSDADGALASFKYHATWAIFSGTFPTKQPLERRPDGSVRSAGAWKLPAWAGGRYEYEIVVSGDRFSGTWKGGGDSGTFEMKRPVGSTP